MNCPHCGIAFHDDWKIEPLRDITMKDRTKIFWSAATTVCPACNKLTLNMIERYSSGVPLQSFRAYPANTFRAPTPKEVPEEIAKDYEEACKVLPISEKASAALSRRCLQAILQRQGYPQKDLAKQIDALLNETVPARVIPRRSAKLSMQSETSETFPRIR
jgi:hypothetical protein